MTRRIFYLAGIIAAALVSLYAAGHLGAGSWFLVALLAAFLLLTLAVAFPILVAGAAGFLFWRLLVWRARRASR